MNSAASLDAYLDCLAHLDQAHLDAFLALCTADVRFRDPFNDVRGGAAFRAVFADMLEKLDDIEFLVDARALEAAPRADGMQVALVSWRLRARLPRLGGAAWAVAGCSEIHLDRDGRVCAHLDYWDAASGLYERLPLLGRLLRYLRRRLAVRV